MDDWHIPRSGETCAHKSQFSFNLLAIASAQNSRRCATQNAQLAIMMSLPWMALIAFVRYAILGTEGRGYIAQQRLLWRKCRLGESLCDGRQDKGQHNKSGQNGTHRFSQLASKKPHKHILMTAHHYAMLLLTHRRIGFQKTARCFPTNRNMLDVKSGQQYLQQNSHRNAPNP
jgi:hypothetical protein